MAEPKYKLWYFKIRGLAEPIRLLFHAAGIPFEDHQFEINEWAQIKPILPGGRVPVLQTTHADGKVEYFEESMAIARLFARKNNMMGSTDDEYFKIERIIGQCQDVNKELYQIFHSSEEKKATVVKEFQEINGPKLLNLITKSLESSGGKHVAGNKITLGDLVLYSTLVQVETSVPGYLEKNHPQLHAFFKALPESCPNLHQYIQSRPKTAI